MAKLLRSQQEATSQSFWHLLGVGTACTGLFAGGGFLYYRCVWFPRTQSLQRQAFLRAPPKKRTELYVTGSDGDMIGEPLRNFSAIAFYGLVVARVVKLFIYLVPLFWFAFLTYSIGFCSEEVLFIKVREFLSSMGPSYIKLGQWMATRPDFVPEKLCEVLSELYDSTTPHKWSHTEKQLRRITVSAEKNKNENTNGTADSVEALGNVLRGDEMAHGTDVRNREEPQELRNALHFLCEIETVSVKSGSIAQIHRAKLRECVDGIPAGTELAIKVIHPHVRMCIGADVVAMRWLVHVITFIIPSTVYFDLYRSLHEFSSLIRSQLNLVHECDNLQQFIFNFRDFNGVVFPRPLPSLSTEDVLVETFEEGEPLQEITTTDNYREVAEQGCHIFLKMLFDDNFVHSDLHPGNVLLRTNPGAPRRSVGPFGSSAERYPDGKVKLHHELVILDTGLVTRLSKEERNNFIALFAAVACGDNDLAADLMLDSVPEAERRHSHVDRNKFREDMRAIFDIVSPEKSEGFRLSNIQIGPVLANIMKTLREHKAHIDGGFATLALTIIIGEGLGRKLISDYNIFSESAPYLIELLEDHELRFLANKLQQTYGTKALLENSTQFVRFDKMSTYVEALTKKAAKTFSHIWESLRGSPAEDTTAVNG